MLLNVLNAQLFILALAPDPIELLLLEMDFEFLLLLLQVLHLECPHELIVPLDRLHPLVVMVSYDLLKLILAIGVELIGLIFLIIVHLDDLGLHLVLLLPRLLPPPLLVLNLLQNDLLVLSVHVCDHLLGLGLLQVLHHRVHQVYLVPFAPLDGVVVFLPF